MEILVTGSSGFTGEELIPKLIQSGFKVVGLDIKPGWQLTILNKDFYFDNTKLFSLGFQYSHDVIIELESMTAFHPSCL